MGTRDAIRTGNLNNSSKLNHRHCHLNLLQFWKGCTVDTDSPAEQTLVFALTAVFCSSNLQKSPTCISSVVVHDAEERP